MSNSDISTSWQEKALCIGMDDIFFHSALDYSPTDPEFSDYSEDEHVQAAKAKRVAEDKAVDKCFDCPVMLTCEMWSLRNKVFGVSGGMTEVEREQRASVEGIIVEEDSFFNDALSKKSRVDDAYAAQLLDKGMRIDEVAELIGCSTRTVIRARNRAKNGSDNVNVPRAKSPWMTAVFSILSDGKWHSAEEILNEAGKHVPEDIISKWRSKASIDADDKNAADRLVRSRLLNSLAATARNKADTERDAVKNSYRLSTLGRTKYLAK